MLPPIWLWSLDCAGKNMTCPHDTKIHIFPLRGITYMPPRDEPFTHTSYEVAFRHQQPGSNHCYCSHQSEGTAGLHKWNWFHLHESSLMTFIYLIFQASFHMLFSSLVKSFFQNSKVYNFNTLIHNISLPPIPALTGTKQRWRYRVKTHLYNTPLQDRNPNICNNAHRITSFTRQRFGPTFLPHNFGSTF